MQIGFIGLGSMGSAMALNLVKAGHDVRAWNRSNVAQESVPGVTLVKLAADAFEADAVFTMLCRRLGHSGGDPRCRLARKRATRA